MGANGVVRDLNQTAETVCSGQAPEEVPLPYLDQDDYSKIREANVDKYYSLSDEKYLTDSLLYSKNKVSGVFYGMVGAECGAKLKVVSLEGLPCVKVDFTAANQLGLPAEFIGKLLSVVPRKNSILIYDLDNNNLDVITMRSAYSRFDISKAQYTKMYTEIALAL